MTLDQFRYFTAAATYEHVGRAALAVSISPSVISAAISTLEDEFGCELFRKSGRRIELTSDGRKLLGRFKSILSEVDQLKAEIRGEPEALSGRLRLGASHFLTSRLLLSGWSELQKRHPDLVADIYSMNTAHALAEVLSGRLDLGICFSPVTHPNLKVVPLFEGELVVAVRRGHPILKRPARERLEFLSFGKAVIHKSSQGVESCESHPIFEAMGFQPKIELYFDSDDTAIQKVFQSDSWTFVPDTVAKAYKDQLRLIPLPRQYGKATYSVGAVIRAERSTERVLVEFLKTLKNLS